MWPLGHLRLRAGALSSQPLWLPVPRGHGPTPPRLPLGTRTSSAPAHLPPEPHQGPQAQGLAWWGSAHTGWSSEAGAGA